MESSPPPELLILSNPAALHALKRSQLTSLAKAHGLKANGKNVELVERLEAHGKSLATRVPQDDNPAGEESWAVVSSDPAFEEPAVAPPGGLQEFGERAESTVITSSSSHSSLSSTLRSVGGSLLRHLQTKTTSDTEATPAYISPQAAKMYPSLSPESIKSFSPRRAPAAASLELDQDDDIAPVGIRLVSTPFTALGTEGTAMGSGPLFPAAPKGTTSIARLASPAAAPSPAFVFGSPQASSSTFTFASMPAPEASGTKTAAELVLEEMNRRAGESRGAAVPSSAFDFTFGAGGLSFGKPEAPASLSKKSTEFEGKHKRQFDKMDSIANHYAAKRSVSSTTAAPGPSTLARSSSSRSIAAEPVAKRIKPSTSSKNLVNALRSDGWAAPSAPQPAINLGASVRSRIPTAHGGETKGKAKEVRPGLAPGTASNDQQREERRRRFEMAKARRKSQAGAPTASKRRLSTVVGPKPSGNAASRFLKTTFKKLTAAAAPAVAVAAPARPLASSTASARPAFNASTSSRISTAPRHTFGSGPSRADSVAGVASTKKEPGWKKFDLQASLARPLSYTPNLGPINSISSRPQAQSPAFKRTSTLPRPLSRQPSARVANADLLGAVKPGATLSAVARAEDATVKQLNALPTVPSSEPALASLPPAPTVPFASSSAHNLISPPAKDLVASKGKKTVSSSTRASRVAGNGKGTKGERVVIETRAKKVIAARSARG